MLFNFDTGSDYLWAPNLVCASCDTPLLPSAGVAPLAAEGTDLGLSDSIAYADGSEFSGEVWDLSVTSGDATATDVNVLVVDDWNDTTGATSYHGLCGLSPEVLSDHSELLVEAWYE